MDESSVNEYLNIKGITIIGQYFSYDKNMIHERHYISN